MRTVLRTSISPGWNGVDGSWAEEDFAEDAAVAEGGVGFGKLGEGEDAVDDGFEFAFGGPLQGGGSVGVVAAVAADEALLFDEEGPEVEFGFAAGRRAAGDDGAAAGEALEDLAEDVAADVFDDDVHAAFLGELADLRGPVGFGGVHDEFRAELEGEGAFGVAGGGGDDARAKFAGDLDGGTADATRSADDEDPVAGFHLDAVGEHVHGGAAGEGEGGGGHFIDAVRQRQEGAGGDDDFFCEAAVALDAEELAVQADGFLALPAEFTGAAEDVGLDGDAVADAPLIDVGAEGFDLAGDFAAGDAGERDGNGQRAGFAPEIEAVQTAGADADADLVGGRNGIGQVAEGQRTGTAVGEDLDGFHARHLRRCGAAGQALSPGAARARTGAQWAWNRGDFRLCEGPEGTLVKKITNWLAAVFGRAYVRPTLGGRPAELMQTTAEIGYNSKIEGEVIVTRLDAAVNWFRKNSLWPMPMGLACCAIELMAAGASRFDISRFGAEVMRFSPRQSDVMIVAGTVTYKMALAVRRIYDQMAEPKYEIARGACASTGGMYRSYAVLQGVDNIVPVDVYVAGCPPRPEALLDGFMKLQAKVAKEPFLATQRQAA